MEVIKHQHAAGDRVLQQKLHNEIKTVPSGERKSRKNDPFKLKL